MSILDELTTEERLEAITVARAEAQARGIYSQSITRRRTPWAGRGGFFVRNDGIEYNPTEKQADFIHSTARFVAFFGGRGSGKTVAGAQRAMIRISRGQSGAVMNPDFENFRFSTWPELVRWIPWHKVHKSRRYMRLPSWEPRSAFTLPFTNGARLVCKGLKDPESGRGPNLNFLWYDEGGRDRTGMSWNIAIAGVRVGDDPSAWVTTTPKGRNHWLHNLFIQEKIPQEARDILEESGFEGALIESYRGTIHENRANLDPNFYASMVAVYGNMGWLRQQELDGLFVEAGGNIAQRGWFKIIDEKPSNPEFIVRYWDLAATSKEQSSDDPDYTAGVRLSWKNGRYCLEAVVAEQITWGEIKTLIAQTAHLDGDAVPVVIEQEPGGAGKNIIAEFQDMPELIGYEVYGDRPEGDKLVRANSWFAAASNKKFDIVRAEWTERTLDQIVEFPDGMHDDIVDAISGAVKSMSTISGMEIEASIARLDRDKWSVGERDAISVESFIGDRDESPIDSGKRWRI